MKRLGDNEELTVKEQAARWLCEPQDDTRDQRPAFTAWLRESPRHAEEFLLTAALWKELDRAGPQTLAEVEAELTKLISGAAGSKIVVLEQELSGRHSVKPAGQISSRPARPVRRSYALAAAVLLTAIGWAVLSEMGFPNASEVYNTATGEQRALRLADGSIVHLNTRSRVEVHMTADARIVRVLEGEALFTVEHDPLVPFRVQAGDSMIRAIGTQFAVYRRAAETTVSVLEGVVRIEHAQESLRLAAGEQAIIAAEAMTKHAPADIADWLAWRERRLVFRATKLADIVEEFARYGPRHIRLEGEAVRNRRLTASFAADDPDSLILFLQKLEDLSVESNDREIVVRARQ